MKKNKRLTKAYFSEDDLHLFELPQIFTAGAIWLESGMQNQIATFDLFVRAMPKNRNFLLMGGTEEIVNGILNWQYTKEEIKYLLSNKVITPRFASYLKNFRFTGSVCAMPEGTVFFQNEPVLRITAPIIEGNILTMFLINAFCSNTIFLSKVVRGVLAAKDKKFLSSASLRAQGNESAFKYGRAVYLAGGSGPTMIPAFCRKYNLPFTDPSRKIYHAVIKSFPSEFAAMRCSAQAFPNIVDFMVDTYNFHQGMKNAIQVAKNIPIQGITIDSGDLLKRSRQARKMLDLAGLNNLTITAAGNLDEFKINRLVKKQAPIDKYMAISKMISSNDAPSLDAVYKLAEVQIDKKIIPKAKLTADKISYPGRKQVFRIYKNGKINKDIIGLEQEKLGKPLLKKIIAHGKIIGSMPTLNQTRQYLSQQLNTLPSHLLSIEKTSRYAVEISQKINAQMKKVRKIHA